MEKKGERESYPRESFPCPWAQDVLENVKWSCLQTKIQNYMSAARTRHKQREKKAPTGVAIMDPPKKRGRGRLSKKSKKTSSNFFNQEQEEQEEQQQQQQQQEEQEQQQKQRQVDVQHGSAVNTTTEKSDPPSKLTNTSTNDSRSHSRSSSICGSASGSGMALGDRGGSGALSEIAKRGRGRPRKQPAAKAPAAAATGAAAAVVVPTPRRHGLHQYFAR